MAFDGACVSLLHRQSCSLSVLCPPPVQKHTCACTPKHTSPLSHTHTHSPTQHTEGRVYADYQGLEDMGDDVDTISNATYLKNFKDFISKAEPQWDADKKNQLFYQ